MAKKRKTTAPKYRVVTPKIKITTVRGENGKVVRETERVSGTSDKGKAWTRVMKKTGVNVQGPYKESTGSRVGRMLDKLAKKKIRVKKVLRKGKRPTLTIKEHEPAPYIPLYIKEQIKEDRRQFYFK